MAGARPRVPLLGLGLLAVGCLLAFWRSDATFCSQPGAGLYIPRVSIEGGRPGPADGAPWMLASSHAIVDAAACPTTQDVAASPWARSCYHLTKVCVDQGKCGLRGVGGAARGRRRRRHCRLHRQHCCCRWHSATCSPPTT